MYADIQKDFNRTARTFTQHLVVGRVDEAHAMLCGELQNEYSLMTVDERFRAMNSYRNNAALNVEVISTLDERLQRQPDDLGWAYVAIDDEGFSEAILVVVSLENERTVIRTLEWGQP